MRIQRTLQAEADPSSHQTIFKQQIEEELKNTCMDVIGLLTNKLLEGQQTDGEAKVCALGSHQSAFKFNDL